MLVLKLRLLRLRGPGSRFGRAEVNALGLRLGQSIEYEYEYEYEKIAKLLVVRLSLTKKLSRSTATRKIVDAELHSDYFVLVLVLVLDQLIQNYERILIAARGKVPTVPRPLLKTRNFKKR